MRQLEASLDGSSNSKKQTIYDQLRDRHKVAMQRIISDMNRCA